MFTAGTLKTGVSASGNKPSNSGAYRETNKRLSDFLDRVEPPANIPEKNMIPALIVAL